MSKWVSFPQACSTCGADPVQYGFAGGVAHAACDEHAKPMHGREAAEGICPFCGGRLGYEPGAEFARCPTCGCRAKADSDGYEWSAQTTRGLGSFTLHGGWGGKLG